MDTTDWQTWAALGAVAVTIGFFVARSRKKKSGGCSNCQPGRKH